MKHRRFCERFLDAMAAQDGAAMDAMIHPDFVLIEPEGLPYRGVYRGRAGWAGLVRAVIGTWGGFRIQPIEMLGETEDTFVVRFAVSGRSRRTGKKWESSVLELWRFRDELLVEICPYYFDTHALALADQE